MSCGCGHRKTSQSGSGCGSSPRQSRRSRRSGPRKSSRCGCVVRGREECECRNVWRREVLLGQIVRIVKGGLILAELNEARTQIERAVAMSVKGNRGSFGEMDLRHGRKEVPALAVARVDGEACGRFPASEVKLRRAVGTEGQC